MKIITRKEARNLSLRHYFTGKECKFGHRSNRYTRSGSCCECERLRSKENLAADPTKIKRWKRENSEYYSQYQERYRKENSKLLNYHCNKRRKIISRQTPPWEDQEILKDFYKSCPEGHHVDHYYPLQGKLISGLHCVNNLQYLPAKDNLSKGNSFPSRPFRQNKVQDRCQSGAHRPG